MPGSSAVPTPRNHAAPIGHDLRQVGQRLGVVDRGRTTGDPAHERPDAVTGRDGVPAVQPMDECALLPRDEAVRRGVHRDGDTGLRPAFDERVAHGGKGRGRAAPDAEPHLGGTRRVRRQHRSVEHQVGVAHDQQPIFLAGRLALRGIDHDDPVAAGDRVELDRGGKARATPSTQPRGLDLSEQRPPASPVGGGRWCDRSVVGERHRPSVGAQVSKQPDLVDRSARRRLVGLGRSGSFGRSSSRTSVHSGGSRRANVGDGGLEATADPGPAAERPVDHQGRDR